jgi:hypothetical protein
MKEPNHRARRIFATAQRIVPRRKQRVSPLARMGGLKGEYYGDRIDQLPMDSLSLVG